MPPNCDRFRCHFAPSTQYIRRPASSYASCIWCATACASCHGRTTRPSLAT
ncbi:heat-stable enterotoxin EAST1 [Escherichia coli]